MSFLSGPIEMQYDNSQQLKSSIIYNSTMLRNSIFKYQLHLIYIQVFICTLQKQLFILMNYNSVATGHISRPDDQENDSLYHW